MEQRSEPFMRYASPPRRSVNVRGSSLARRTVTTSRSTPADHLAPWTFRTPGSSQVDLAFTPFHNRSTRTDVGPLANRTDQCFGHCYGRIRDDRGRAIVVEQLLGWAEDVHMRW
jgi:hypothetical protein